MTRNKSIVLIGEAYGRQEEAYDRPFIGPAGQLLVEALRECGLERYQVHITNVCMFRPSDESGGNRPPTEEEIRRELPRLYADVFKFDYIILLGATAHRTLSPRGDVRLSDVLGLHLLGPSRERMVSIWHPAYILRNRHLLPEFISLLRGALK